MNKKAFTLLELLVVVLIIGILAGIALPQYKKAVLRSRIIPYFPVLSSIKQSQESFYLTHSRYASRLNDLDIQLPASCVPIGTSGNIVACSSNNIMIDNYLINSDNSPGAGIIFRHCPGFANQFEKCRTTTDVQIVYYFSLFFVDNLRNKRRCEPKTSKAQELCNWFLNNGDVDLIGIGY